VFTLHPTSLANIHLVGPSSGVGELILAKPPRGVLLPHPLGYGGIVLHVVDQTLCPVEVLIPNLLAAFRFAVGVLLVSAGKIEGNRGAGIHV
jgi:hypothetical protein